jgi:L-lactate dehydrogenase
MGHTTHGLQLLAPYLAEIEKGSMALEGGPEVLSSRPAAQLWDGRRLPGPWLVLQALEQAARQARTEGTGTVVIRRSHHIGCLASYHRRAAEQGLVLLLTCSDPNTASVAPFGGLDPVFTPNPISAGFPTGGTPRVHRHLHLHDHQRHDGTALPGGRQAPGGLVDRRPRTALR